MSKAVYWMFVGALFKDSSTRVLKHYRPYVDQVEQEAQIIAEQQIQEEENKQYYLEHKEQLEQEYQLLRALNASNNNYFYSNKNEPGDDDDDDDDGSGGGGKENVISYDSVERLVKTWASGGAMGLVENDGDDDDDDGDDGDGIESTNATNKRSWWWRQLPSLFMNTTAASTTPEENAERAAKIAQKLQLREEKRKERLRAKALKEAAKVVVDYRPVMSRIITDYLFRCPSWHYAHIISRNRVKKDGNLNNVYVYRFSQPTHVPGFKECWGKSCHTAELPYVFQSMEVIRSNYSTLSSIAEDEAPSAPEYPYTEMLAAFRGVLQKQQQQEQQQDPGLLTKDNTKTNSNSFSDNNNKDSNWSNMKNYTGSFQRILTHFFGDYFREDADEEIASDMAERWVEFSRSGDPNYDGSKVQWIPWRYVPSENIDVGGDGRRRRSSSNDMEFEDYLPWESTEDYSYEILEQEEVDDNNSNRRSASRRNENGRGDAFQWSEHNDGRDYRRRALRAMNMAVAEEDMLRTELTRTKRDPDMSFALKFLSNFGLSMANTITNNQKGETAQVFL
jgi:hypothetical protein